MKTRIMYMERKAGALTGSARIGRVTFNRTGRTIYYRDQVFRRIVGGGFKSNYIEEATGEDYWVSGCKRRGGDSPYVSAAPIEIDEDVREEYWTTIRNLPEECHTKCAQPACAATNCSGRHGSCASPPRSSASLDPGAQVQLGHERVEAALKRERPATLR